MAHSAYQPILDRILCRNISKPIQFSPLGVYIPAEHQKTTLEAEVVAVGDSVYLGGCVIPMPIAVGDIVKYSEFNSEEILLGEDSFLLIRVPDVKAVKRAQAEIVH